MNDIKLIQSEVNILRKFNHQNIIQIYNVKLNSTLVKPNGSTKTVTYIALELA
jgi:serine/threonine protein kinase